MTGGTKLALAVAALLAAVSALLGYRFAVERSEAAALRASITVLELRADSLTKKATALEGQYRVDTVKLTKQVTRTDTVLQHLITESVRDHHDTITVTREVLVQADSTIKACRIVQSECEAGWANERQLRATLQAQIDSMTKLDKTKRSVVPAFGVGAAAGVNPQGKFDAVAGVTLGWTFGRP